MPASLLIFATLALLWLVVLRPQQRRIRTHRELTASLAEGDEVITSGGIYGVVSRLDGEVVHLDLAPGTTIRVARGAVVGRVTDDDRAAHEAVGSTPSLPGAVDTHVAAETGE